MIIIKKVDAENKKINDSAQPTGLTYGVEKQMGRGDRPMCSIMNGCVQGTAAQQPSSSSVS